MEDPVAEIPTVIRLLTQSPPALQQATLARYFTPAASFTHPFCRTGSYDLSARYPPSTLVGRLLRETGPLPAISSRALTAAVYRWYKILSPTIELSVDSVALDGRALVLYVGLRQVFRVPAVPFYAARVDLVTVLQLEREAGHTGRERFRIAAQNDRYQVDAWIRFVDVLHVLWLVVLVAQFAATAACLVGQAVCQPVVWAEQRWSERRIHQAARRIDEGQGLAKDD